MSRTYASVLCLTVRHRKGAKELAYVITHKCTRDFECVKVCPVNCIYEDGAEGKQLIINPDECIDCDACVTACPVDAIFPIDQVPAEFAEDIERNAAPFRSGTPPPVAVVPV